MTAPIEVSGSEAEAQPDAVLSGVERKAIQGRSLGQIAWLRLRRDKVAMAGGIFVLLLVVVALPGVTELLVKLLAARRTSSTRTWSTPPWANPTGRSGASAPTTSSASSRSTAVTCSAGSSTAPAYRS